MTQIHFKFHSHLYLQNVNLGEVNFRELYFLLQNCVQLSLPKAKKTKQKKKHKTKYKKKPNRIGQK